MPGVVELAQYVFGTSAVRPGNPENLGGRSDEYKKPEYATVIGLIQSQKKYSGISDNASRKGMSSKGSKEGFLKRIFKQIF